MKRINGNSVNEIADMAYADVMLGANITKALFIDVGQKNFVLIKARHTRNKRETKTFEEYDDAKLRYKYVGMFNRQTEKEWIKEMIQDALSELILKGRPRTSWPVNMMVQEEVA